MSGMKSMKPAVLVIEDDEGLNLLIHKQLEKSGFDVESALTGADAFQRLANKEFQALLIDYALPDMDGRTLVQTLSGKGYHQPFIIMTGYGDEKIAVEMMKMGAGDYFVKDEKLIEVLPTVIDKLIDHDRKEKSLHAFEEKYRLISENTVDVIWTLDVNTRRFTYTSPSIFGLRGFTPEEAMSQPLAEIISPGSMDIVEKILINRVKEFYAGDISALVSTDEIEVNRRDGSTVMTELVSKLITNGKGEVTEILGVSRDITERKIYERNLQVSIKEKEALLRELYHRTKNNMQVICAMLAIQANQTENEEVKSVFREMNGRIQSMALVHEKLYQSQNLSNINLADYIKDLVKLLSNSLFNIGGRIAVHMELEDVSVLIDVAIPCGIILNELISNSLKHAFPGGSSGDIYVTLKKAIDGMIEVVVSDNGVGFPPGFDIQKCRQMGLQSVFDIGENQLEGKVTMESKNGLKVRLNFKDFNYKKRI